MNKWIIGLGILLLIAAVGGYFLVTKMAPYTVLEPLTDNVGGTSGQLVETGYLNRIFESEGKLYIEVDPVTFINDPESIDGYRTQDLGANQTYLLNESANLHFTSDALSELVEAHIVTTVNEYGTEGDISARVFYELLTTRPPPRGIYIGAPYDLTFSGIEVIALDQRYVP